MFGVKYLFFWTVFILTIVSYAITYFFEMPFSMYSIFFGVLLFLQLFHSYLNRKNQDNIRKEYALCKRTPPYVDVMIVGYRENVEYWKTCLNSVKNQTYKSINVIISVDGNEQDDMFMYRIAKNIFPYSVILMNKHGGKRSAIIHGYKYLQSRPSFPECKYVVLVDSDTILDKYAIENLVCCVDIDDSIGCATGNIRIFNNNSNFLTKIINARYAYAFNIERSYLSHLGIMNCCSGPLSIYRKELITEGFIEKFKNQTMFGVHIEPGDDRHQTLLIMMSGYKSRMTPFAIAYTETPKSFERFIRQQLRWMRSFYRESYWQYKCLKNQPFFLSFVTVYELQFPFFVTIFFVYALLFSTDKLVITKSFIITFAIAILRTLILCVYTRNVENIYNFFYLFIYLLFLIPTKLYSSITFLNNDWNTSNRLTIIPNKSWDTFILYFFITNWLILVMFGSIHTILS